jgi:hypothetical protein
MNGKTLFNADSCLEISSGNSIGSTFSIQLDSKIGTLSFSQNGNPFQIAFENERLKGGNIYPGVSL